MNQVLKKLDRDFRIKKNLGKNMIKMIAAEATT